MRAKHEGQLQRWSDQAVRGALLSAGMAMIFALQNGPQRAAADDAEAITAGSSETQQMIRAALLKTAGGQNAPACSKCSAAEGSKSCCCGDPTKCACGK